MNNPESRSHHFAPVRPHLVTRIDGHRLIIDARSAREASDIARQNGHDVVASRRIINA